MDPITVWRVTAPNRDDVLAFGLRQAVADGWRVESTGAGYAVLVRGKKQNEIVHVVLILFTCGLWLPVWLAFALLGGERRAMLTVAGNQVTLSKMSRSR